MSLSKEIPPKLTVVIPVCERYDDLKEVIPEYAREVQKTGLSFEIIAVVDGPKVAAKEMLAELVAQHTQGWAAPADTDELLRRAERARRIGDNF